MIISQTSRSNDTHLRPLWRKLFSFNWKLGLFLVIILCVPRFLLVLHANATKNYAAIGLIMILSAVAPFIFLSRDGRREIGLTRPANQKWLLIAFASGMTFSFILYFAGSFLYGNGYENWYAYIGQSYNIPHSISAEDKRNLFFGVALTSMIFSPVGEELFFRGIVHSSFSQSIGESKASAVDSAAFALTHLSHFGIIFIANQWFFAAVPALIWVISMFLVSILFFICRKHSGSILGAIICHAGFNLGMTYCIFYLLNPNY